MGNRCSDGGRDTAKIEGVWLFLLGWGEYGEWSGISDGLCGERCGGHSERGSVDRDRIGVV